MLSKLLLSILITHDIYSMKDDELIEINSDDIYDSDDDRFVHDNQASNSMSIQPNKPNISNINKKSHSLLSNIKTTTKKKIIKKEKKDFSKKLFSTINNIYTTSTLTIINNQLSFDIVLDKQNLESIYNKCNFLLRSLIDEADQNKDFLRRHCIKMNNMCQDFFKENSPQITKIFDPFDEHREKMMEAFDPFISALITKLQNLSKINEESIAIHDANIYLKNLLAIRYFLLIVIDYPLAKQDWNDSKKFWTDLMNKIEQNKIEDVGELVNITENKINIDLSILPEHCSFILLPMLFMRDYSDTIQNIREKDRKTTWIKHLHVTNDQFITGSTETIDLLTNLAKQNVCVYFYNVDLFKISIKLLDALNKLNDECAHQKLEFPIAMELKNESNILIALTRAESQGNYGKSCSDLSTLMIQQEEIVRKFISKKGNITYTSVSHHMSMQQELSKKIKEIKEKNIAGYNDKTKYIKKAPK